MEASIDPVAGIEWLAGLFPVRAPRRGSLTVMFTDIAGFTAYAATRGDRAAARLVHRHDAAVLPAIRRHSGRILVSAAVRGAADGLAARFRPARALAIGGREPRPLFRVEAAACQRGPKARCTEGP